MRLHTQGARLLALLLLCSSASIAAAQNEKAPKRPKLSAAADTNDPRAYYDFAIANLTQDSEKAADALYWSSRLEPMWADAYYARRIALLLSDHRLLSRYWAGDRNAMRSSEVLRSDSLFYQALTLNPFVSQMLDRQIFEVLADDIAKVYESRGGSAVDIRYAIDLQMAKTSYANRAWLAYGGGDFNRALHLYAEAIKEDKRNGPLHTDRARIFAQRNELDSALVELNAAIEDLRTRDKKDLVFVYQSKALAEHSVAVVQQRLGHNDAAREAYGRALQEDLSYYPAHMQLALMSLDGGDTTTALTELDLTVQLRKDDPSAHYLYGYVLGNAGKIADSETHLRKALELDPFFAAPRLILAAVLETTGKDAEAIAMYRAFLATSPKTDLRRKVAEDQLAALTKLQPPVKPHDELRTP